MAETATRETERLWTAPRVQHDTPEGQRWVAQWNAWTAGQGIPGDDVTATPLAYVEHLPDGRMEFVCMIVQRNAAGNLVLCDRPRDGEDGSEDHGHVAAYWARFEVTSVPDF